MIALALALGLFVLVPACRYGRAGMIRLANLRFRGGALALLASLAQLVSALSGRYLLGILLTAGLLAGFCWLNRRQGGILLAAAGIALNLTVMAANGGIMPVSQTTFARISGAAVEPGAPIPFSKDRVLNDDQAALAVLGDRLLLPGPLAGLAAWSIGDALLLAGVGWLFWHTMKGNTDDVQTCWSGSALP